MENHNHQFTCSAVPIAHSSLPVIATTFNTLAVAVPKTPHPPQHPFHNIFMQFLGRRQFLYRRQHTKRFRTTPVITPILMIPKPLLISVWHHPPMFQHQTDLKTKVKVMTPKSKKSTSTLSTTTLIQTMNPTHRVRIRIHFDGFKFINIFNF